MSLWPISVLLSLTHSYSSYSCHPHIVSFLPFPAPFHLFPSYPQHLSVFHFICLVHYAAGLFFTTRLVCFVFKLICPLPICFYSWSVTLCKLCHLRSPFILYCYSQYSFCSHCIHFHSFMLFCLHASSPVLFDEQNKRKVFVILHHVFWEVFLIYHLLFYCKHDINSKID